MTKKVPCETCGRESTVEVRPDGFDDAPVSFTISRTCSGFCPKAHASLTPEENHKLTGLPVTGWPLQ